MLHELTQPKGAVHKKRRKGRGGGSTQGTTAGRGQKGQKARSKVARGFEGGQNPLHRRLPRRGFRNPARTEYAPINLDSIVNSKKLGEKTDILLVDLQEAGLCPKRKTLVKILGRGELTKALTLEAHSFSQSAREKIEKAGGKASVISSSSNAQQEA